MITIVGFYCYGIVPLVSLERPHHGGRGGGHPEYWGRDGLEVPVEVIHQASTGSLDVFGDQLCFITDSVTGRTILEQETPATAEDEDGEGDGDADDDQGLGVIKLGITVLETGKKLVAQRSEAETQKSVKLKRRGLHKYLHVRLQLRF